jgi:exopolysaccharide biosynthesis WecB/TagA/CpsF family protein
MPGSSAVTSWQKADPAAKPRPLAMIDGWGLTVATPAETIAAIVERALNAEDFDVFTLNLDHLVKLRRDQDFRQAYAAASIVTADGAPIVWLARRQGAGTVVRTTGADLVRPLVLEAARHKLPVYLFGTTDEVLAKSAAALRAQAGGQGLVLEICGMSSPPHGFDPTGPAADAAIASIRASGARLVFVALGAPKQELFSAHAIRSGMNPDGKGVGFVCIGAALDFIVGHQTRAPGFMQRTGLEWAWRLATNPRRLGMRYAECAAVLADIAVVKPLRQRLSGNPLK